MLIAQARIDGGPYRTILVVEETRFDGHPVAIATWAGRRVTGVGTACDDTPFVGLTNRRSHTLDTQHPRRASLDHFTDLFVLISAPDFIERTAIGTLGETGVWRTAHALKTEVPITPNQTTIPVFETGTEFAISIALSRSIKGTRQRTVGCADAAPFTDEARRTIVLDTPEWTLFNDHTNLDDLTLSGAPTFSLVTILVAGTGRYAFSVEADRSIGGTVVTALATTSTGDVVVAVDAAAS